MAGVSRGVGTAVQGVVIPEREEDGGRVEMVGPGAPRVVGGAITGEMMEIIELLERDWEGLAERQAQLLALDPTYEFRYTINRTDWLRLGLTLEELRGLFIELAQMRIEIDREIGLRQAVRVGPPLSDSDDEAAGAVGISPGNVFVELSDSDAET